VGNSSRCIIVFIDTNICIGHFNGSRAVGVKQRVTGKAETQKMWFVCSVVKAESVLMAR